MWKFKEKKIGEVFEYEGITLKCVKSIPRLCSGCYFEKDEDCSDKDVSCACFYREDEMNVKFVKQ